MPTRSAHVCPGRACSLETTRESHDWSARLGPVAAGREWNGLDPRRTDAPGQRCPRESVSIVIEWDKRGCPISVVPAPVPVAPARGGARSQAGPPRRRPGAPGCATSVRDTHPLRCPRDRPGRDRGGHRRARHAPSPDVHLEVFAAPGLGYYQLKNESVKRATGVILVFLDSDVIPEPDWLDQLLGAFTEPDVQIVGGNSYIEAASVYSRAFALWWFFPLRAPDGPPELADPSTPTTWRAATRSSPRIRSPMSRASAGSASPSRVASGSRESPSTRIPGPGSRIPRRMARRTSSAAPCGRDTTTSSRSGSRPRLERVASAGATGDCAPT